MIYLWRILYIFHVKWSSSVQSLSHVGLCHSMDCNTPGFTVHHQLLEFTQTHIHRVGDAIQPPHPLLSPSPSAFNLSQPQIFSNESVLCIRSSASASVLPMNIQDWSPLGWTGWISLQSMELSRVFSNSTVEKHQFFSAQLSLPTILTSIHEYWKNHSFD